MQRKLLFFLFISFFLDYRLLAPPSNVYHLGKSNNIVEFENKKTFETTNKKLAENHSRIKKWSPQFLQLSNFSIQKDFYTPSIPQSFISEIFTSNSYHRQFPVSLAIPLFVIKELFTDLPLFTSIIREISQKNIQTNPISKEKLYSLDISNSSGYKINYYPTTINYLFPIHSLKYSSDNKKNRARYSFYNQITYKNIIKLQGNFIVDIKMEQQNNITYLDIHGYFQLNNKNLSWFVKMLNSNYLDKRINQMINSTALYIIKVGREAAYYHYHQLKKSNRL